LRFCLKRSTKFLAWVRHIVSPMVGHGFFTGCS
jgi:hypothetical protein